MPELFGRVFIDSSKMSSKYQKSSTTEKEQVDNLLRCIEKVKSKHDGQYIDNIASACADQLGWDRPKTVAALRKAVELEAIREVTTHGKTSYRCIQPTKNVIIRDSVEVDVNSAAGCEVEGQSPQSNTDVLDESVDEMESQSPQTSSDVKDPTHQRGIESDFQDFKEFVWGELASLRNQKIGNTAGPDHINYEKAFIRSLEHRILSLEKQLEQKQQIIEKLLINNNVQVQALLQMDKVTKTSTKESHTLNKASFNGDNRSKGENNGKPTKETAKTSKAESLPSKQQKSGSVNANENTDQNEAKKVVYLVGDSLLHGIHERGLTKKHSVKVKAHGGATTRDMIDHIKPVLRRQPDTIIVHCGTNDLTANVNTIEQMEEILKVAKQESSNTKIVISSVVTRADQAGMKKKVSKLNNKLKTFCNDNGIKLIDHSNINDECLATKRLHLNKRGDSFLANNFLKFIGDH